MSGEPPAPARRVRSGPLRTHHRRCAAAPAERRAPQSGSQGHTVRSAPIRACHAPRRARRARHAPCARHAPRRARCARHATRAPRPTPCPTCAPRPTSRPMPDGASARAEVWATAAPPGQGLVAGRRTPQEAGPAKRESRPPRRAGADARDAVEHAPPPSLPLPPLPRKPNAADDAVEQAAATLQCCNKVALQCSIKVLDKYSTESSE